MKYKSKYITFDVMLNERFVCTMRYPACNAHTEFIGGEFHKVVTSEELEAFVLEQRPSLRNQPYRIAL